MCVTIKSKYKIKNNFMDTSYVVNINHNVYRNFISVFTQNNIQQKHA